MKQFSIKLILLLALFSSANLLAEETGFFGNEYDMNVFKPRKGEKIDGEVVAPTNQKSNIIEQQEVIKNSPAEVVKSGSILNTTELKPPSGKHKVSWLGIIINAHDQAHFFTEIGNFLQFAVEHDYDLGPVYAVGKDFSSKEMNKVSAMIDGRGGAIFFSAEIPSEFSVKKSPAWIVGTKEGQYLLEGVTNFQKYFNSSGELIVKSDT